MSQTAAIETNKVSDQNRAFGNGAADAARNGAETAKSTAREAIATTTAAVERQSSRTTDIAQQGIEASRKTFDTANRGGAALATFWLQVMQEQTEHNVEVMRSLVAARSWQEKLEVQTTFFSGSLSRIQDVFSRYMALAGTVTTDLHATGAVEVKKDGLAA